MSIVIFWGKDKQKNGLTKHQSDFLFNNIGQSTRFQTKRS